MSSNAKIRINAGATQEAKINPYIFGHFVEDIRDHMDAMLAFVLKDMDFEDEALNGVSAGWYPINNGKNTKFELEPAAAKHSGHSQKIRIFSGDQCDAGGRLTCILRAHSIYVFEIKKLNRSHRNTLDNSSPRQYIRRRETND